VEKEKGITRPICTEVKTKEGKNGARVLREPTLHTITT